MVETLCGDGGRAVLGGVGRDDNFYSERSLGSQGTCRVEDYQQPQREDMPLLLRDNRMLGGGVREQRRVF